MSGVKAEQKHPADCRSLALQAFFQKKKRKAHSTFAIEDTDIRVMWCTFRSNLLCRVAMLFVSPCRRVISRRGGRARAATAPSLFFNRGFSADSWSGGKRAKNAKKKKKCAFRKQDDTEFTDAGGQWAVSWLILLATLFPFALSFTPSALEITNNNNWCYCYYYVYTYIYACCFCGGGSLGEHNAHDCSLPFSNILLNLTAFLLQLWFTQFLCIGFQALAFFILFCFYIQTPLFSYLVLSLRCLSLFFFSPLNSTAHTHTQKKEVSTLLVSVSFIFFSSSSSWAISPSEPVSLSFFCFQHLKSL